MFYSLSLDILYMSGGELGAGIQGAWPIFHSFGVAGTITTEAAPPFAIFEGWDLDRYPFPGFPQPNVTSNLDLKIQRADHSRGGGGAGRNPERGSNSIVLKILTSKPLGLKILQTIFANPAPVAAFRGVGGEGDTPENHDFPKTDSPKSASRRQFLMQVSLQ
jgi:hypothetical protein